MANDKKTWKKGEIKHQKERARPILQRTVVKDNAPGFRGKIEGPLEGFPGDISEVFKSVADEKKTIIISRVPGPATLTLIDEGYDLKGYHIKAKSCDWGPMAGFLCKHPLFNKKGVNQIAGNLKSLLDYRAEMKKVINGAASKDGERKKYLFPNDAPDFKDFAPFIPIKITNKRKQELLEGGKLAAAVNLIKIGTDDSGKKTLVGCYNRTPEGEYPQDGKIVGIFAFSTDEKEPEKKEEPIWNILFGPIKICERNQNGVVWRDYSQELFEKLNIDLPPPSQDQEIEDFKMDLLFQKEDPQKIKFTPYSTPKIGVYRILEIFNINKGDVIDFYTVYGISNPDTTNKSPQERDSKAAVTGDYDIFCYWPLIGSNTTEFDLRRLSDKNYFDKNAKPSSLYKPTTLKFNFGEQVVPIWIEFIPHYKEIDKLESPDLGNYYKYGNKIKDILNETAKEVKKATQYTIVKHSDEGGRPSIDEIDLPLYVFHPMGSCLEPNMGPREKPNKRLVTIIDFIDHLERIINDFQKRSHGDSLRSSHLIFHHAWVTHLLALTLYEPIPDIGDKENTPFTELSFVLPPELTGKVIPNKVKDKSIKFINTINQKFYITVNEAGKKENPNWTTPKIDDQIYNQKRLELFAKVVYVLFGFQSRFSKEIASTFEAEDQVYPHIFEDEDYETYKRFRDRLFPFLHNFTLKLLEYTLDGDMKAIDGLNNVRSTLLSKKLNQVLNPQPHG
jgi:hypothetical protein